MLDRYRASVVVGNRSIGGTPPAVSNLLETERLVGSKINLVVTIGTEKYLFPNPRQALLMFELAMSVDRGMVEPAATDAGRPPSGASGVLLVAVPQVSLDGLRCARMSDLFHWTSVGVERR